MLANTRHNILQGPPLGGVIKRVERRQQCCTGPIGHRRNIAQTGFIISAIKRHKQRINLPCGGGELRQLFTENRLGAQRRHSQPTKGGMARQPQHIVHTQQTFTLAPTPIGLCQTLRQRAISGTAARIGNHLKATLRNQSRAGQIAQTRLLGCCMAAHHTG